MLNKKHELITDISKFSSNDLSVFYPDNNDRYKIWRETKLAQYPRSISQLIVNINNPYALTTSERQALLENCRKANMTIYQLNNPSVSEKDVPRSIATQLGLIHIDKHLCVDQDGISPLQVSENKVRQDYIPYTNKPINWHTDGYYNSPEHTIRGMVLHCVNPAASGGENAFVDHEIAYIHLRDKNPDFIHVLMQEDVMTIPANDLHGEVLRPEQTGPVFSILEDGNLHMRYSARTHNIIWKAGNLVQQAITELLAILNSNSPYIFHHQLQAGQGIICNNVLHKRTGFMDDVDRGQKRLLYRARYYDRVN